MKFRGFELNEPLPELRSPKWRTICTLYGSVAEEIRCGEVLSNRRYVRLGSTY